MMIMLLLLLLPALVRRSDQSAAASPIDWTQCTNARCYCWKDTANLKLELVTEQSTFVQDCSTVGIQSKFFTADIALFQMNVIGSEADNLGDAPSLMFVDGTTATFGCKLKNKETGEVEIAGKKEDIANYKLSLFEDRTRFEKGRVVCAVLMELAFKFAPGSNDQSLKLSFTSDKEYKFPVGQAKDFYIKSANNDAIRCNPFLFKDLSLSSEHHVKPIINRDSDHLNCDNYNDNAKGILYTMRYIKKKDPVEMKELRCEKDVTTFAWRYNLVTEVNSAENLEPIPNPEAYTFYCAIPFTEMCKQPACAPNGGLTCPDFNKKQKTVGQPPTLECDDKKWVLEGNFYELAEQPTCQKDEDGDGSVFVAKLPSGFSYTIADGDRCFTEYDCTAKSFLDMPIDADDAAGGGIDKADAANVLRCADQSRKLRVTRGRDNLWLNDTSYVCNKKTGEWYNDTTIVPDGASVACIVPDFDPGIKTRPYTERDLYFYIGGAFFAILFVLGGCAFVIHLIRNKINDKHLKGSAMAKMPRPQLIKNVNEQFDRVIVATPSTHDLIVEAMEMIAELLKSEAYDTSCWTKVYLFLIRLEAVVSKMDTGILHMLNRYLYLQAAKIIEKRGWLADKPIVTMESHEELMRVVAIRLLTFPLRNRFSHSEAEQLIRNGFRQLGWRGGAQYPHAGVLWSVIGHALPKAYSQPAKKASGEPTWWDCDLFLEKLYAIAEGRHEIKMPDVLVRSEFGTVRQQAAFALGGAPEQSRTRPFSFYRMCWTEYPEVKDKDGNALPRKDPSDLLAVKNPEIPMAAFAGMCEPIEQIAAELIIQGLRCTVGRSQETLDMMYKMRPEAEWQALLQKAQKFAAYCGAAPDAQKLHERFGPKGADYKEELSKMQFEHVEFEAAVEAALSDLRKWLAERTDKDEFKQVPVYLENTGANKLDDVIPDQSAAVKPLGPGCEQAADVGGSASASQVEQASGGPSGASGSSGSKSSSSEAAAAAAAAATPTTPDAVAAAAPTAAPPVPDSAAPAAAAAPVKP